MDTSVLITLLVGALCLVLGAIGGWAFARRTTPDTHHLEREMLLVTGQRDRLEAENEELIERAQTNQSLLQALSPIAAQLSQVDNCVRTLEMRNTEHFTRIRQQLDHEAKVTAQLASSTQSLQSALTHSSSRGSWGEIQLRRVVEAAGMLNHVDFDEQRANSSFSENSGRDTGSQGRPDVIIHLPNDGHIAIDAKVPMSAYLEAQDIPASDLSQAPERAGLLRQHAKAVRSHVDTLKKRNYPADFPESPQLTVMFLPSEALLSEAIESDPQLLEDALSAGIIPTSPASLLALLRSVGAVWRSASVTEDARDIVRAGRELVDRLDVFTRHLEKLGASLSGAVKNYNSAIASLESRVLVSLRKFDSLGEESQSLGEQLRTLDDDSANIREITQPELLVHSSLVNERKEDHFPDVQD